MSHPATTMFVLLFSCIVSLFCLQKSNTFSPLSWCNSNSRMMWSCINHIHKTDTVVNIIAVTFLVETHPFLDRKKVVILADPLNKEHLQGMKKQKCYEIFFFLNVIFYVKNYNVFLNIHDRHRCKQIKDKTW